mmetsp:Transcript_126965/g.201366  ORF Transcript_126965/g.201366 Transcript_126965/m.201366 type:complete len:210 (-) Transcript_126965:44-673(-)
MGCGAGSQVSAAEYPEREKLVPGNLAGQRPVHIDVGAFAYNKQMQKFIADTEFKKKGISTHADLAAVAAKPLEKLFIKDDFWAVYGEYLSPEVLRILASAGVVPPKRILQGRRMQHGHSKGDSVLDSNLGHAHNGSNLPKRQLSERRRSWDELCRPPDNSGLGLRRHSPPKLGLIADVMMQKHQIGSKHEDQSPKSKRHLQLHEILQKD